MMHHPIAIFLQTHRTLSYLVVFFAMIFEGDLFLFTAAFLTRRGFFDPLTMFLTVFAGACSGDLLWYHLGLRLKSSSFFKKWAQHLAGPFDEHLRARMFHTIFLSKFIYGIHHAILIRAGMIKLKFEQFIRTDALATLVWIVIIGALGFASSFSFDFVRHSLKFFEGGLLAVVIGFLLISYLISYTAKKKL